MTSYAGFFTILWVPLIAFGLFGMQEIAEKLVDPLGDDYTDVPVEQLCAQAASSMLKLVNTCQWNCNHLLKETPLPNYRTTDFMDVVNGPKLKNLDRDSIQRADAHKSLLSHFIFSVPWWQILFIATWSAVACLISYYARKREFDDIWKWWVSIIAINDSVTAFMSTATLTLLGFYT